MSSIRRHFCLFLLAMLSFTFSGCDLSLEPTTLGCDDQLVAKVEALSAAAIELNFAAGDMRDEVAGACTSIATALGKDVPARASAFTDQELTNACGEAKAAIDELLDDVTITVEGGRCVVDAQAQFSCEEKCMVDVTCSPGTVITRCDPGYLSGVCSGSCVGGAVCQGSAQVHAQCSGSCNGTCYGSCDGTDVEGLCAGRCEGSCSGSCQLAADAEINCGASVTCKGGCTVEYKAPQCETELNPPVCQIDTDCEAACRAQASFKADCTPPTIVVDGEVDPDAIAALVQHLPAIVSGALIKGALLVKAGLEVAQTYPPAAKAVAGIPQCLVFFADDLVSSADASISAAATLNGSVQASVSITASVGVTTY
jgi:hypothetical protein